MTKEEALKLALEALEWCHGGEPCGTAEAITALREALAEQPAQQETSNESAYQRGYLDGMAKPCVECADRKLKEMTEQPAQQEPVACIEYIPCCTDKTCPKCKATTPPQRKPLKDEEIQKCYETTGHYQTLRPQDKFAVFALARAIEAAHGIKE